ncbi:IMP cyclohydrolase [Porphyromonas crevioricanis JCM 15906]|uniref:Bifunctional purine biosynthesis protein PurH n=2 Tax=Porphyromonas crevioricanis TaxID=393921 RepID=T1CIB2_9PORP|nr:IMP cyclohydrolase [Porphyromonas crevioricanis JCM 15906]SKA02364.1 phosphoribosylaminoimidazolecarboxamide formyltransferase / IMP cyclohydrolase [Porphyromonas crevioricanis]
MPKRGKESIAGGKPCGIISKNNRKQVSNLLERKRQSLHTQKDYLCELYNVDSAQKQRRMEKEIKRALVSVYHKDGLDEILKMLHQAGVELVSTGGTEAYIRSQGYPCTAVEQLTEYPEMLDGRVKTLHPKIFGGILAVRDDAGHQADVASHKLPLIDLVIVDLYPFVDTVASGASAEDIIEKIDIGGISLIRAAAKNYKDVIIVASKDQYPALRSLLEDKHGKSNEAERRWFAKEAFAVSSAYDAAIFGYFDEGRLSHLRIAEDTQRMLRYGENPHQRGMFYGDLDTVFDKIQGKDLSYNNLQDLEAGLGLIDEFTAPTFAILKHGNACGIASRETVSEAWQAALAADPVSAFGGILVCNSPIDEETAKEIDKLFFELIVAPDYETEALTHLTRKSNRIILSRKSHTQPEWQLRSMLGGMLVQERDSVSETTEQMQTVTSQSPSEDELVDLVFAAKVVKHSKSNAISLVKDSRLLASGVGQTSRVDALCQAIEKARSFGFDLQGAVMSSDAFFPFPDCVEIAAKAGISAIVQPGGSVKDQLSIDKANELGVAMVFTGLRHFKH